MSEGTPQAGPQFVVDTVTRRFVLSLRSHANRGDAAAWRATMFDYIGHLKGQLEGADMVGFRRTLHTTVRGLLTHWIAIVRPQSLGGHASAMYVSDDELVAWLTEALPELPLFEGVTIDGARETMLARLLAAATMVSPGAALDPPAVLAFRLGLDPIELAFALILYQIQTAPDFGRAVSFAINDFTKKEADLNFLFGMVLGEPGPLWALGRACFHPGSALRLYSLVELPRTRERPSIFAGPVRLTDATVMFLDGNAGLGPDMFGWTRLIPPASREEVAAMVVGLDASVPDQVIRLLQMAAPGALPSRIVLCGHEDDGRDIVVGIAGAVLQRSILQVDGRTLVGLSPEVTLASLVQATTNALMLDAILHIEIPFRIVTEESGPQTPGVNLEAIARLAELFPRQNFVVGIEEGRAESLTRLRGAVLLQIPTPNSEERAAKWIASFGQLVATPPDEQLVEEIAARYPLPLRSIESAVGEVVQRVNMSGFEFDAFTREELLGEMITAGGRQVNQRMATLAERVPIKMRWNDIVLPDETLERLMEIITFARYRSQVFESWGFRKKMPYGRALSALFHGPPGTGKTMVAGIIARDLGSELFRVDLSQITSKWIGETEKNLSRVFEESRRHNAVLLFDEADSMFSKRTEVKSSVDRYANMNVNFLLQAMEAFEGVVLLTTNFVNSIDDAFKRRIRFHIEFSFPDEEQRALLWKSMLPPEADVEEDVDVSMIAKHFEMSGGYIKEATLRAAFAAAELGTPISTELLFDAARRVYREMGRLSPV